MSVALSIFQSPPFRSPKENPIMKIIADKQYIFRKFSLFGLYSGKLTVAHNDEEGPQER